jgi:hypothetical protein
LILTHTQAESAISSVLLTRRKGKLQRIVPQTDKSREEPFSRQRESCLGREVWRHDQGQIPAGHEYGYFTKYLNRWG